MENIQEKYALILKTKENVNGVDNVNSAILFSTEDINKDSYKEKWRPTEAPETKWRKPEC